MTQDRTDAAQRPLPYLTLEQLQTKPWRYIGYKGFAEWMASDNDFFVVRRFDNLAARVVLLLQWEVTKLESRLAEMDFKRSHQVAIDIHNGSFDLDDDDRQQCIRSIRDKLKEYCKCHLSLSPEHRTCLTTLDDFINSYASLRSKPEAASESKTNVRNWLKTHPEAISPKESAFIDGHDDLFAISATVRTPLRRAFERFRWFRWYRLFRRVPEHLNEDPPNYYDPDTTVYYSDKRVDSFVNIVICISGFLILVVPLWILYYLSSRQSQLAVITVFIAAFLSIVQSVTIAKPFESLAATAA